MTDARHHAKRRERERDAQIKAMRDTKECPACNGTRPQTCIECSGTGRVPNLDDSYDLGGEG